MTTHELAKKLLEGPDRPVTVSVANPRDTAYSDDVEVVGGANSVKITGWVASYNEQAFAPWADYDE